MNKNNYYDKIKKDKKKIIDKIEYPYLKYYMTEEQVINNFKNLKKFNSKIINEDYKFTTLKLNYNKFKNPITNKEQHVLIIDDPSEYETIELISDYFNENC